MPLILRTDKGSKLSIAELDGNFSFLNNKIDGLQGGQGIGNGAQGVQGFQGAIGFQGLIGLQGLTGSGNQGAQGTGGTNGSQGFQGLQGIVGFQGLQGITNGVQGFQGIQGETGSEVYRLPVFLTTLSVNDYDIPALVGAEILQVIVNGVLYDIDTEILLNGSTLTIQGAISAGSKVFILYKKGGSGAIEDLDGNDLLLIEQE